MRRRDLLVGGAAVFAASLARAQTDALTQSQFDDWVATMRGRALAEGVSSAAWDSGLQGLAPDPVVIARRAAAAETNQTVTDYVLKLLNGRGQKARARLAAKTAAPPTRRSLRLMTGYYAVAAGQ